MNQLVGAGASANELSVILGVNNYNINLPTY